MENKSLVLLREKETKRKSLDTAVRNIKASFCLILCSANKYLFAKRYFIPEFHAEK